MNCLQLLIPHIQYTLYNEHSCWNILHSARSFNLVYIGLGRPTQFVIFAIFERYIVNINYVVESLHASAAAACGRWYWSILFPLIPACTARPGLPLSPPETAFLESPYYRPQTASIADRHHPTNFHSVTYTQNDDAAFEAGSDNDHKSFLRMRVIFTVEYPAELFRFRRVLDDILSSFDVF